MPEIIRKYEAQHLQAAGNIERLTSLLGNLPEPESGLVTWGHVGDLVRINQTLDDLLSCFGKEYK